MDPTFGALPPLGELVDRYRVVSLLGRGGMAAVFAVKRSGAGGFEKVLALKMMLPHLAGEPQFVRMFLDESRVCARVQHRNVVQVFDVGEWNRAPYLVMELLRGRSLAELTTGARLPPAIALGIVAQAAEGLHAAHEATDETGMPLGLVHRDVSPQNIFVCGGGDVKVVDFGIAAARGRLTVTKTGELRGKLSYVAPEQVTRAYDVSRAADIWSLGVVAWELLVGRPLFRSDGGEASTLWDVVSGPIEDVGLHVPSLPAEAREAIHRCLERDPGARPASLHEIAATLSLAAREMGGGDTAEIARYVAEATGGALAGEHAELAAMAREPVVPLPVDETRGSLSAKISTPEPGPPRRWTSRGRGVVLVAVAGALATGAALFWSSHRAPSAASHATNDPATPPPPPPPPSPVAAPVATFSVEPSATATAGAPSAAGDAGTGGLVGKGAAPASTPRARGRGPAAIGSAPTATPLLRNPF